MLCLKTRLSGRPVNNFQALIDAQGKDLFDLVAALAPPKKGAAAGGGSSKGKTPAEDKDRQGPDEARAMVEM